MSYSQLIWSSKQWSYVASESQHRGLWLVKLFMLVVVFCFYVGKMFLLHATVLIWCQSHRHQGTWANDLRQATPRRWESWQSSLNRKGDSLPTWRNFMSLLLRSPEGSYFLSLPKPSYLTLFDSVSFLCPFSEFSLLFIFTRIGFYCLPSATLISILMEVLESAQDMLPGSGRTGVWTQIFWLSVLCPFFYATLEVNWRHNNHVTSLDWNGYGLNIISG